jgi:hypothetical protein
LPCDLLDARVRFANVVLAVLVRIKVNLAGSSEADGDSGDEEGVAECRVLSATGRTFILHFELVTVRTLGTTPSLTSRVGTVLTSKFEKNDIVGSCFWLTQHTRWGLM